MKHDVCALSDLSQTGMSEVEAGGLKILLAREGDTVHATDGRCTHKGAPLANGTRVGNSVICPFHHAIFDITTGDHREPPGQGCLNHYATEIAEDRVYVEIPEGATAHRAEVAPEERHAGGKRVFAIVGSGAGGLACAQQLVRSGFDGRIVMFAAESEPPYDRTDLSKGYLQGQADDDDIVLATEDDLDAIGVERITQRVERIDHAERTIHFKGKDGLGQGLVYDGCFAAPGSDAATLPLENADLPNVLTLRTHDDAKRVKAATQEAESILIVGSGFIGMEAAAGLVGQGKAVTVVTQDTLPFVAQFGEQVAGQIAAQHRANGVELLTNSAVYEIVEKRGSVDRVRLNDGTERFVDAVILAVGAKPRLEIFDTADEDGVPVDANLAVNDSLYVGGDVARAPLHGRGLTARVEHWRVAEQHGRHAARALLGETDGPFDGVPFVWSGQYGPIHYVGHSAGFDEVHVEGDLDAGKYTAFYIKQGKVVAALGRGGKADTTSDLHAVMLATPTPDRSALEAVDWQPARLLSN